MQVPCARSWGSRVHDRLNTLCFEVSWRDVLCEIVCCMVAIDLAVPRHAQSFSLCPQVFSSLHTSQVAASCLATLHDARVQLYKSSVQQSAVSWSASFCSSFECQTCFIRVSSTVATIGSKWSAGTNCLKASTFTQTWPCSSPRTAIRYFHPCCFC